MVLFTSGAASAADLLVNMTPAPTTVVAGANVTYTIRVDNNALDDALNVVLTAALPSGSEFISVTPPAGATCTYPAPGTCNLGTVEGGGTRTVVLVLRLTTPPSFTNTASVTTTTTDTDLTNNSISKTVTVVAGADLRASKTGTPNPVVAGANVTYTITTENLGPQSASTITVTDTLPTGTTFMSFTATGWACSNVVRVVTCTRPGPAAIGALPNITLVARATATGTITNSVTIGSAVADPQPNNNTATFDITVSPGADVSVTKTVAPNPVATGSSVVWTIVPTNIGPLATTNLTVTDQLPAGLTFVSVTPAAQCSYDSGTNTVNCLFPGPVASGTNTASVLITTTADTAGGIANVVTVGSDLADPATGNNSRTSATLNVQAVGSDLRTTKVRTPLITLVPVGGNMSYSVTVRNWGPSAVPAGSTLTVTDTLPAAVTFVSASGIGWSCAESSGTVTCTRPGPLALNATTPAATIEVRVETAGSISNTACASATLTAGDPIATNNCGTATNTATTAAADLLITKSSAPNPVAGGFPLTYTLTVTNNGPDPATSVVVTDTLASSRDVSATSTVGTCTGTGTVTCNLGNMANGASATITVQLRPLNPPGTRANSATVTSQTGDPVLTNNSASGPTVITAGVDIQTTKIVTPDPVLQGANVTFVITTINNGPAPATGVTMTDTLPANIRLISVTPSQGACPTQPPLNTPLLTTTTLTCTIGALASGAQQTVTVIAEPTTTGAYVNTATSSTPNQPDWNASNDTVAAGFTVLTAQIDLSVIKVDSVDPVGVGTNFNYLITAVNNGPSRATSVVLTENLPSQFAFVSISTSKGSCAGSGPVTCSFGDLARGEAVSLTLTMTASTIGSFTNQASVSATETDTNPLNNTTSEQTTAKQEADLSITKTGTPDPVRVNENISFTLTVGNAGPAASAATNVTDTLPGNLTLISATPSQGTCAPGNPFNCALGTLATGGSATITVVARAASAGAATNTATVSGSEPDSIVGNNSASFPFTVTAVPDLTIAKTHAGNFPLGGTGTFSLNVQNVGGAPTDGTTVTVADTLPAGYTPVSAAGAGWTCTVTAPAVSCTRSDALTNGLSYPAISLSVDVAPNAAATLNNTATVSGGGDNTPLNNESTDTVTNAASADLAITKTNGVTTLVPGTATTYTIVASNLGPSDASGATVSDTPPVGLTGATWTCVASGGATCPAASGSGAITATVAVFPAGGTLTYSLSGTVSAGATGTLVNTATVTAPGGVTDPTPANDTATDTDTLTPTADLGINKTSAPDPYVTGAILTYTITVANAGPSDVTGASVADTVPTPLSGFIWSCTSPSGACGAGTGNIATTVTLLNGQSATITLGGTVPGGTTGPIVNTATVTAPSGITDPIPGNNTSTNTNPSGGTSADLQITKTDGLTTITAGGATTYVIVVSNAGPGAIIGATVTDTAPVGLTFGTWTCVASAGSACPATGSGDLAVAVSLLPGGTATFTVPAAISSTATSPLTNTATVVVPSGNTDPAPGNNTASDTNTVSAPPSAVADLIVTKTDGVASVISGGTTEYTVVVTNNGPDGAANAIVTDPAAPGLTKTAVSCLAATGAVCPTSPTFAQLESGLLIPTFPTGGSVTLLVTATVTAVSGSVSNTVTVAPPTTVTDPAPGNNSATDTNTVTVTGPVAEMSVTKTNGTSSVTPGGTTTYTIVVANAGPAAADGAVVTDAASAGLAKSAVSCAAAGGAVCPAGPTVPQLEGGLTIPTWPAGGSVTLLVTANVLAASGSVSNTVTVAPPTGTTDPTPGDNTATDTDAVGVLADVSVTKTDGVTTVMTGATTTYTIVVSNAGPGAADGVIVTDPAAVGLTKIAVSCVATGGAVCPASPTVGQLESGLPIPTFPTGGSVTLLLTATVTAVSGSVSNTVTVATPAGVTDPTPANNSATDTDTVTAGVPADLAVTKTNGVTAVSSGGATTYTIVVANAGPSAADGAVVIDPAAAGLVKSAVTCVAAGGAECPASPTAAQLESGLPIPTFPTGGSVTLQVTASVTASSGSVSNTVTVTPPTGTTDPTPGNNTATDTDTVGPALTADLSVTKTDGLSEIVPGQTLTYTIVAGNAGPGPVAGAMLQDPAPAGMSFSSWTCTATVGSSCVSTGSGQLSTPVSLAVGGTATFTVSATVAADATGTITNTATITPPVGVSDPVPANNTATDSDTVAPQQVGVVKRAGTPSVVGPSTFEIPYTVTLVNEGRVPLTNVQVSDSLSSAFATGDPTLSLPAPVIAAPTGGATAGQCAVNGGFTGLGPAPGTATNLLVGTTSLGVQQGCVLTFTVRVAYPTAAAVPRDAQVNRAEAWTSTKPGGPRLASDRSDAEVVLRLPRVDITKALTALAQVGDEPVFEVSYTLVVLNTSEISASNVQVIDDLAVTFAAGSPAITLASGPSLGEGDAPLTLAGDFNGTTRTSLLTGTDIMPPGASRTITFTVRLRFASGRDIPEGQDVDNTARVTTSVTAGGVVISTDDSTDVTELGASPRADDVPSATALRFAPRARLSLLKIVSTRVVEVGDALSYAVRVTNFGGPTLPLVILTDRLPLGFRYVPGSAHLAAGAAPSQPVADPAGSPGPVLSFTIPAQPTSEEATLVYRVRLGPGALQGNGVNTAEAATLGAGAVRSNLARAGVLISGGVFTPDACVIGKIFADVNGNHVQDEEELGVPGVHVRLEEGTVLVSDVEGKYSYCGLTPATHVLKVDRSTLPQGAQLTVGSNRNAGDAGSLFVDLKFGDVHRADFVVEGSADPRVLEQIVARRSRGEVWEPSFEGTLTTVARLGRTATQQPIPVLPRPLAATPRLDGQPDAATEIVVGVNAADAFASIAPLATLSPANSNAPDVEPHALDDAARAVGVIRLAADRVDEVADGNTPVRLTIRLLDSDGGAVEVPVTATIEIAGGHLQLPGYRAPETGLDHADAGPATPGTQIQIEQGVGVVELIAPTTAQDVRVRITAGDASVEGTLTFLPHARPLLVIGLVEGQIALTRIDASAVAPAVGTEVFDRELRRFSRDFSDGQGQMGGRAALFLKGTVKGDYLLTLAYDSEKEDRGVLFRDIQPEAFYPIYGDSSLKGFDAQTSGRFYLRAERGRSYLLYGDLQTAGIVPEARNLGIYSRSLTGVQHHLENKTVAANFFASRDSLTQVIDEIGGLGISGPYSVSNANGVSGTEKVEIITRDRNQPAVILSAVPLTRFADYEFEPFSGRLLFRRPVPAVDERLNPVSVRVTYEVDRGGEKSWVGGVDGQVRLGRLLQVGGSWAEDRTPGAPYRLRSVNGTLKLGSSTTLVAEGAQTMGTVNTNFFNQTGLPNLAEVTGEVEGIAGRAELRHDSPRASARLFAGTSDPGFNNPASTLTGGRTEIGGRGTLAVAEPVRIIGEAIRTEDRLTGGHRQGALLAVEADVARNLVVELGVRRARESLAAAQGTSVGVSPFGVDGSGGSFGFGGSGGNIDPVTGLPVVNPGLTAQLSATSNAPQSLEPLDVFTVRGKVTFAAGKAVSVYGEAEQDVRDADKKLAAVGAQLRLNERTRLYLRHEFISSLDGPYALSDRQRSYRTVFGVSSTYLENADVFSEYRMRDAISGREAHAAIGLRNLWPLANGVALSTSVERLHSIAGLDQAATAASVGLEYTRNPRLKGTGRVEWRHDRANDSWLSTAGLARKLSRDWTALSKNYFQLTAPRSGPHQVQNRFWLGGAYRQTGTNRVNLLSRYEFRYEDTLGLPLGLALGVGARRDVHSVSTHVDFHPARDWTLFGQHAVKWVNDRTEGPLSRSETQLASGRIGYDLTRRIDLGLLASEMWSRTDGSHRHALGGEVGLLLRDNLWLSLGYNITGFVDRDMIASEQTTRGAFLRLRMKFDEELFGRGDSAVPNGRRP